MKPIGAYGCRGSADHLTTATQRLMTNTFTADPSASRSLQYIDRVAEFHFRGIQMRKCNLALAAIFLTSVALTVPAHAQDNWQTKVSQSMPLLGHRNWILIVDSAYPLQSSPGVETIETNASHFDVLRYVLGAINSSIHVRPLIYMDKELPFVSDDDAPGTSAYRTQVAQMLADYTIESMPHERVIAQVDETSKQFHVLVLKTTMTIPYSSVFIRLDCKYWSADAERRMRARMH